MKVELLGAQGEPLRPLWLWLPDSRAEGKQVGGDGGQALEQGAERPSRHRGHGRKQEAAGGAAIQAPLVARN